MFTADIRQMTPDQFREACNLAHARMEADLSEQRRMAMAVMAWGLGAFVCIAILIFLG